MTFRCLNGQHYSERIPLSQTSECKVHSKEAHMSVKKCKPKTRLFEATFGVPEKR